MVTELQRRFALCIGLGYGNWQAANLIGYRDKDCSRMRRSRGVVQELKEIRREMIEKTYLSKEYMLQKLFTLMGRLEGACYGAEQLEPRESREQAKVALEIAREINKMLGHYAPVNTQHLRVEGSGNELSQLIEKVEKRCKAEKEVAAREVE